MYQSFYSLSEKPFEISSDPRFLWLGTKHKEALAVLKYGLIGEKGFLLLTGDVGAGKTTLVNALLKSIDDGLVVANVTDPSLDLINFLNHIALTFNIPQRFDRKEDFLFNFKAFLQKSCLSDGKHVLLIIDEAHKLSKELLEQIRLLSNIELPEKKFINIFLVGQNELNQTLMDKACRALRQRITLNYNIKPLKKEETRQYIKHRLEVAGTKERLFDGRAIQEIHNFSGGCPRLINMICDRALLTGYVRGRKKITANAIKECSQELLLPGERNGDLLSHHQLTPRTDVPTAVLESADITESVSAYIKGCSVTENEANAGQAENDAFPLKEPTSINADINIKERNKFRTLWGTAMKPGTKELPPWILKAISYAKSKTEESVLKLLKTIFLYGPGVKGLKYCTMGASAIMIAMVIFLFADKFSFSKPDHLKPQLRVSRATTPVENENTLIGSDDERNVVVSTNEKKNVGANDDAGSAKRSLLERAEEAMEKKNYDRAMDLLEEAVISQKGNQEITKALYSQAIRNYAALLPTQDIEKKKKLLQKAIHVNPQNAIAHYDLGKLYFNIKDHIKAIEAYEKAAELDFESANTLFNLGFSYAAIKDYVNAEQMFLRVTALKPPYLDKAIVNLALVQYKQGKNRQCKENLGKALEVNPDNQRAKKYLAQLTYVSGDLQ